MVPQNGPDLVGNHLPREMLGATKQFLKPTQSDCSWKCNKSHDHVGKLSISPACALLQFAGALIVESVGTLMGQVTTDPKKLDPHNKRAFDTFKSFEYQCKQRYMIYIYICNIYIYIYM